MGRELKYFSKDNSGFNVFFVNDSILKSTFTNNLKKEQTSIYKYTVLEKQFLERIKKNQPVVNFKTRTLRGQFIQKIAIERISGYNKFLKDIDTLIFLKIRQNGKMTELFFFDGGNRRFEM